MGATHPIAIFSADFRPEPVRTTTVRQHDSVVGYQAPDRSYRNGGAVLGDVSLIGRSSLPGAVRATGEPQPAQSPSAMLSDLQTHSMQTLRARADRPVRGRAVSGRF